MSEYKHQAKATRRFGIEFRSKLESQWAYWFDDRGLSWDYADHPWYDFEVEKTKVEIKPASVCLLFEAVFRIPLGETCIIYLGSPPGNCFAIRHELTGYKAAWLDGSWWKKKVCTSASITRGRFADKPDEECWCRACGNEMVSVSCSISDFFFCKTCKSITDDQGRKYKFESETVHSLIFYNDKIWQDAGGCWEVASAIFADVMEAYVV